MNYKWLIIIILIGGIAFVAASIMIGIEHRDIVVEDDPYKAGLAYDENIKKYSQLGWNISCPDKIKMGDSVLNVRITDKNGKGVEPAQVEFLLQSIGVPDVSTYKTSYEGNGAYSSRVHLDKQGYWDVRIKVKTGNDIYKFDRKFYAEQ
jgi:hypothetical protein